MKNIRSITVKALLGLTLLASVACRDVSQSKGTEAGQRSNGETRGTEKPEDNQDSGKSEETGTDSGAPPANNHDKKTN